MMVRARRGVALMLVLWLVVLLATVGAAVAAHARTASRVAVNVRARTIARYAAESGVEAAVAELEAQLAARPDALARATYLNALPAGGREQALGDARWQVALVDASARLDLNLAGEDALAALFARVGAPDGGRAAARAVQAWLGAEGVRDGVGAAGGVARTPRRRQFRSLDDLARVPGVSPALARAAAPHLTVDGDGRVNLAGASAAVRAAARGETVREPTRLVIVSRGWQDGVPLTHEIQAVYAVRGDRLAFVRWRERDL